MTGIYSTIASTSTNQLILNNLYNSSESGELKDVIGKILDKTDDKSKEETEQNKTLSKLQDYASVSQAAFDAYQAEVDKGRSKNQQLVDLNNAYSGIINQNPVNNVYTAKAPTTIATGISAEVLIGSLNK